MTFTKDITIYDVPINATNGEVIKALFPNEKMFEQTEMCTYYGNMRFDTEWWNAPYQKGGE